MNRLLRAVCTTALVLLVAAFAGRLVAEEKITDLVPRDPVYAGVVKIENPAEDLEQLLGMLAEPMAEGDNTEQSLRGAIQGLERVLGISLGDDLLAHLGGEIGLVLDFNLDPLLQGMMTAGPQAMLPAMSRSMLLLESRDREKLEASLHKMFAQGGAVAREVDGVVAVHWPEEGQETEPLLFWGFRGDTLLLGASGERVRLVRQGLPAEDRLGAGEDFRRVFENLSAEYDAMTYLNLPRLSTMIDQSPITQGLISSDPESRASYDSVRRWAAMDVGMGSTSIDIGAGSRRTSFGPSWLTGPGATMAMISAVAIPNLFNAIDRGKQKRTLADIRSVAVATESFAIDNDRYPGPTEGLVPLESIGEALSPVYIRELPLTDGWGHPLLFRSAGTDYVIISPGKDGEFEADWWGEIPGAATTGPEADIVFQNGQFVRYPEQ